MNFPVNKLVVFLLIDGWGVSSFIENNAIRKANIPGFKNLLAHYPATIITPPSFSVSHNYRLIGLSKKNVEEGAVNLSLSRSVSRANLSQLKIANSYDFPLISVFMNNHPDRFLNEDWIVCDNNSSNIISFFNKSSLTDKLIRNIKSNKYNFICSSFSDISQSYLSGDFLSTISSVEEVSYNLEKVSKAVLGVNGTLVISSTYGGAEDVYNLGTGIANKKRSTNPVPFIIVSNKHQGRVFDSGEAPNNDLSLLSPTGNYLDIAPTILKALNLMVPVDMEGNSLL